MAERTYLSVLPDISNPERIKNQIFIGSGGGVGVGSPS